jgi:hypothetical protein
MLTMNTPLTQIDAYAKYAIGQRFQDKSGSEYIYLKGIGSTAIGSWVTYSLDDGTTALLAANAKGLVAVAMAATIASTWGWYQIAGLAQGLVVTATSADTTIGRETADGSVGDGRATGDEIVNAICLEANASGGTLLTDVQIMYPFVNDATGA